MVEKSAEDDVAGEVGSTGELRATVDDACAGLEVLAVEEPATKVDDGAGELEGLTAGVGEGVGELYGGGPTGLDMLPTKLEEVRALEIDKAVEEPTTVSYTHLTLPTKRIV